MPKPPTALPAEAESLARAVQAAIRAGLDDDQPSHPYAWPYSEEQAAAVGARYAAIPAMLALTDLVAFSLGRDVFAGARIEPKLADLFVHDAIRGLLCRDNPDFPGVYFANGANLMPEGVAAAVSRRFDADAYPWPQPETPDPAATAAFEAATLHHFLYMEVTETLADKVSAYTPNHYEVEVNDEDYDEDALVATCLRLLAERGIVASEEGVRRYVRSEYVEHVREEHAEAADMTVGGEGFLAEFYPEGGRGFDM